MIDLAAFGRCIYTCGDQGGILEKLVEAILPTKDYVEFGVGENGAQNNTLHLKKSHGFTGLWLDACYPDTSIPIYREFVTAENVEGIFKRYRVPMNFGVLSVDIDRNDWHVLRAILAARYRPQIIVVEYNASLGPTKDRIVIYSPTAMWDGTVYFGASIVAFSLLGKRYGYTLVCSDCKGIDLFFVQDEQAGLFLHAGDVGAIYRKPKYNSRRWGGGHPPDRQNRAWTSAEAILTEGKPL